VAPLSAGTTSKQQVTLRLVELAGIVSNLGSSTTVQAHELTVLKLMHKALAEQVY
jgi:hypothetical protein